MADSLDLMAENQLDSPTLAQSAQETGQSTFLNSCLHCRRRKVRCNKTLPCDNCMRLGFQCTFPPPGRRPWRNIKSSKADLISRLRLLEQKVEQLRAESVSEAAATDRQANLDSSEESPDSTRAAHLSSFRSHTISSNSGTQKSRAEIFEATDLANAYTLERQNGRLLVDRRKGTSRYVNHRVLTEMGHQVIIFSCPCIHV